MSDSAGASPAASPAAKDQPKADIGKIREELQALVKEKGCGPILIRLAWHDAGTYCRGDKTGGPRGCMRFQGAGEACHGANAGLEKAVELLAPIKQAHALIGTADLWALAAVVAVEAMGGPRIRFRCGRKDAPCSEESAPDGRLPDATQGADHLREVFERMGFSDRDIVALSGCHTVGHCHRDRSGFEGPWTEKPLVFDNQFFKLLLEEKWEKKEYEDGPRKGCTYYQSSKVSEGPKSGPLIMLPTDMALIEDAKFRRHVERYAKNPHTWSRDFAQAFRRLTELGVEFPKPPLPRDWKVSQDGAGQGQRVTRKITLVAQERPKGVQERPEGDINIMKVGRASVAYCKFLYDNIGWGETALRSIESPKELERAFSKADFYVLFSEGVPVGFADTAAREGGRAVINYLAAPGQLYTYFLQEVAGQVWDSHCSGGDARLTHVITNWARDTEARAFLDVGFQVDQTDVVTEQLPIAQGLWCTDKLVAPAIKEARRAKHDGAARGARGEGRRQRGGRGNDEPDKQQEQEAARRLRDALSRGSMATGELAREVEWREMGKELGFKIGLGKFLERHPDFSVDDQGVVSAKKKRRSGGRRRGGRDRDGDDGDRGDDDIQKE
eukprot:TRINITY_DN6205_c0_g1_i1.p1 TRINITY_DN6205_c0_g1~~TRINITY_DN6205_c0_g1_i1.p1  ORF type:complete len:641 (+),score=227.82 TRINITY_DN6205_c0_g1_i1:85-1923(+)